MSNEASHRYTFVVKKEDKGGSVSKVLMNKTIVVPSSGMKRPKETKRPISMTSLLKTFALESGDDVGITHYSYILRTRLYCMFNPTIHISSVSASINKNLTDDRGHSK